MSKWKQATVDVSQIVPTEVNANKMTSEEFARLKDNIKKSGGLSSAIGCYKRKEDGRYVIISGNHRYQAALELRYTDVPVIYADEEDLSKDEIIALQLSHNSLHGSDDKGILKRLFDEICDVEFKAFAYIDVNEIKSIDLDSSSFALQKEQYSVGIVIYRDDLDTLTELIELTRETEAKSDIVLLADGKINEKNWLVLNERLRKELEIKSTNICFAKLLQLASERLDQLKEERMNEEHLNSAQQSEEMATEDNLSTEPTKEETEAKQPTKATKTAKTTKATKKNKK